MSYSLLLLATKSRSREGDHTDIFSWIEFAWSVVRCVVGHCLLLLRSSVAAAAAAALGGQRRPVDGLIIVLEEETSRGIGFVKGIARRSSEAECEKALRLPTKSISSKY